MKKKQQEGKMFRCECYQEGVSVEAIDDQVFMAFWQIGKRNHNTLGMRIRNVIKTLLYGNPFNDMVVLSPEEASKLGNFLIDQSNRLRLERACREKEKQASCNISDDMNEWNKAALDFAREQREHGSNSSD